MTLSIIIVNYNVKYFLEQCLCSVHKAIRTIEAEVLVIDNHSSDNSITYLKPLFPWVTFLANNQNVGFSKASNQALSLSKGKYVLFLNPDTIIPEDCFTYCIRFFKKTADAGALGIRMINGEGIFLPESKRAFPSPLISFLKLTGWSALFPASGHFTRYNLGTLNKNLNHEVGILAGAFMMVKREILVQTGGFDETFFMYGEDIDLSYRIQKTGFKNYYLGKICIIHFKGESTQKENSSYIQLFYKAMTIFVHKYYGNKMTVSNFCIQLGIQLMTIFSLTVWRINKIRKRMTNIILSTQCSQSKHNRIKKTGNPQLPKSTMIIGSKEEYIQVKMLLLSPGKQKRRLLRIDPSGYPYKTNYLIHSLCLINILRIEEVIFCQKEVSYSMAITLIQLLPHHCFSFFCGNNIVGSQSAEHRGKIFTQNDHYCYPFK